MSPSPSQAALAAWGSAYDRAEACLGIVRSQTACGEKRNVPGVWVELGLMLSIIAWGASAVRACRSWLLDGVVRSDAMNQTSMVKPCTFQLSTLSSSSFQPSSTLCGSGRSRAKDGRVRH